MKIKRLFEKNYWTIHYYHEYEDKIGNIHCHGNYFQMVYALFRIFIH